MSTPLPAALPETGLLRLPQIIGQSPVTEEQALANQKAQNYKPKRARQGITPLIAISRTQWWLGVASGRFPKPITGVLGERISAWRAEDIRALIQSGSVPKG
jgi:prophage regulatory protein